MARTLSTPRWMAWTLAAAVVLLASLYAFHRLEQFLIRDARFTLSLPGAGSESLEISGSTHASARAIQAVFAEDFGGSVYLIPLSERRASLRSVDWIKDVSVARFWPNRIIVGINERKPVAFIPIPSGRPALIDEEGVILPAAQDRFTLPVLFGVSPSDAIALRRERVQRLLGLMKDLGEASRSVSDVDVSDSDNLKISELADGHLVTLLLGDRNFALRHRNFISYFPEIHKKVPAAAVLDLRLEDRITVVR